MRQSRRLFAAQGAAFALSFSSCTMPLAQPGWEDGENCPECKAKAKVCENPTMMALAHDLDHLEKHIERYGSVVIKQPDVWGQARLTKYREEFEKEMYKELGNFQVLLQGSTVRQDQAFFANATALSAAISSTGAVTTYPRGTTILTSNGTPVSGNPNVVAIQPPPAGPISGVGTVTQQGTPPNPQDVFNVQAFSPSLRVGTPPAFVAANVTVPANPVAKTPTTIALGIGLEPTIVEEQKARFLNALNQIRRTNEGDDTADSPGYSLNLVRVPVSVLPGKCTRTGHGAEVTMTMTPVLGDELLPVTFRNLVTNDLVDQIGFPMVSFLNDKDNVTKYLGDCMKQLIDKITDDPNVTEDKLTAAEKKLLENLKDPCEPQPTNVDGQVKTNYRQMAHDAFKRRISVRLPSVSSGKVRNARLPFPASQLLDIYGADFAFHLANDAYLTLHRDLANREFIHLPDLQSYLREELTAAYKFLTAEQNQDLWHFCDQGLAELVRARRFAELENRRDEFRSQIKGRIPVPAGSEKSPHPIVHSTTAALVWAILVESALLNDQLVRDMKETASAKGCCLHTEWLPYHLPAPPPEARQAFNQYVSCRWPIHVFALDPETQDQNLADSDATRRELQLALSLAFVSGQINASNLTRYARRLDAQYDTIDLNRTAVGFSHGEDVFGWRFYPRFQTPDTESNATVLFRDMLIGGPSKDALLRERKLEPGMRECVAIVMMPSFVPYVTCDVASNWFQLTNPKCKTMDSKDALRLSRSVKAIQTCGCNVQDADCYRDGDLARLLRKADQLAARLPLQTQQVLVPYENTLGGFQMFSTGVTDLAPELLGWYGAPYVDVAGDTTLFLVGNHLSVKQTRVVAGGVAIDPGTQQELLSRQVVRVTIPKGAQTIEDGGKKFVDVHVATPYGVTQHLLIPAAPTAAKPAAAAKGLTWVPEVMELAFVYSGLGIGPSSDPMLRPADLKIKLNDTLSVAGLASVKSADLTLQFASPFNSVSIKIADTPFNAKDASFGIAGAKLDGFVTDVFKNFKDKFGPEATKPPVSLVIEKTLVDVKDKDGKSLYVTLPTTSNSLAISWVKAPK